MMLLPLATMSLWSYAVKAFFPIIIAAAVLVGALVLGIIVLLVIKTVRNEW